MSSSASTTASVRVEKATSDLLIGPDWTMNMEICDSINSYHWQAKDVVKAVKKRLQHKNPRVQFLALTLLETMMKNCGDYVHLQVVERDILQELIKIVKKKTDMQVRDKILLLLDSWQEAFGGPGGKYPQYYWAYTDLRRSFGIQFPQRSADSVPIFTPPVTHPVPRHPPVGYGMPSNSSIQLEESLASEMGNLSISNLDSIRSVMELLSDMLEAVNANDSAALKDDVIVDLVGQCRSNQKKVMHLVNSTGDEELLAQGLALNDILQSLLAKHDAIASGSLLPAEISSSVSPNTPTIRVTVASRHSDNEEDKDDGFSQLARRTMKGHTVPSESSPVSAGDPEAASEDKSIATPASAVTSSTTESSASALDYALALPDPPAPVRTSAKEKDMIDLLSITLSSNPSPPHTPITPSISSGGSHAPFSPMTPGYSYSPQHQPVNQGFIPNNSYVVPWAQQIPSQPLLQTLVQPQPQPQTPPLVQPELRPRFQPQQPHFPQYAIRYPPPPWAGQESAAAYNSSSDTHQFANAAVTNGHIRSYGPLQHSSFAARGNYSPTSGETKGNPKPRQTAPAASPKPFVPSYRLFEDLVDLRNTGGGRKTSGTPSNLSSSSTQHTRK